MYMSESQKYNSDALELETQIRLADFIKDYLTDPTKETDLIPANTGLADMNIESQINLYNTAKLKRDRLMDDSSENNPVVEELNNSLRAMKQTIIRAVDNLIVSLNVKREDAQNREMRAQSRVSSIPTKERNLLSIERQQKIKESLYMFLLNRITTRGSSIVPMAATRRFRRAATASCCWACWSASPCPALLS